MQVIYVLVRMLFFYSSVTWRHWAGLLVTSMAYGFSYQQLANMAKPSYSDDGELLDGGFDMTSDGICGYISLPSFLWTLFNTKCQFHCFYYLAITIVSSLYGWLDNSPKEYIYILKYLQQHNTLVVYILFQLMLATVSYLLKRPEYNYVPLKKDPWQNILYFE